MQSQSTSKNDYVNKMWGKSTAKYYYIRTGSCNYKKCQAACCRFNCLGHRPHNKKDYHFMTDFQHYQGVLIKKINGIDFHLSPRLCPHIAVDGKCELHKKNKQPNVCKYFPMSPNDGVYLALKHVCSYKFKKIRNPKYKKEKLERID